MSLGSSLVLLIPLAWCFLFFSLLLTKLHAAIQNSLNFHLLCSKCLFFFFFHIFFLISFVYKMQHKHVHLFIFTYLKHNSIFHQLIPFFILIIKLCFYFFWSLWLTKNWFHSFFLIFFYSYCVNLLSKTLPLFCSDLELPSAYSEELSLSDDNPLQDGSPTKILTSHDPLDLEKDLRERLKLESLSPTDSDTNTLSTDHLDIEEAPSEATASIATSTSKGFLPSTLFIVLPASSSFLSCVKFILIWE